MKKIAIAVMLGFALVLAGAALGARAQAGIDTAPVAPLFAQIALR